jgi:chromosome segregation ATPase
MELIVILLSSISGALIGTSAGIYLLYRKLRPITGAELDLTRGKLRSTEFSLSAATARLAEREQQLSAAEERIQAAEREIAALRQQVADNETRLQDATKAVSESASQQIAVFESRVDADDRQIQELNGQVARLTAELEQVRKGWDEDSRGRASLEAQLSTELEHSRELASRVAELEAERSHFDLTLQEERQSAAKGIELLLMAQENLARVFRPVRAEVPAENSGNGHVLVGAAAEAGEA